MAATNTSVTIGSSTTVILPADSGRQWTALQNDSDEDIYIALGASAVLNKGILLKANGGGISLSSEDKEDRIVIAEAINGICVSGSKNLILAYK